MTQIKRISSDKISEDQLNPPNQRSIPPHWSWVKLGDVCEPPQYGYTTSASNNGNLKFLRTTDITSGQIDWDLVPFCKVNPKEIDKYLLKENDVVISRAGSVGYSLLLSKPQRAVFASYLIRFRPKTNPKFFALFLQSPQYWNQISEKKLGIAVPNVNAKKLMDINFPLPPLPEQKKIVEKIEELFSQLDSGVASLKKAKEQIRLYRQSVLAAAFSGRLTGQVGSGQLAVGKSEISKAAEPKTPYSNQLPEGWKWVKLGEITTKLGDGLHGTPKYSNDGEYYFINGNNLSDGRIEIKSDTKRVTTEEFEKYKKTLNNRTVLVSINGTLGKTAFYNGEKIILGKSACYFNLIDNISKQYIRYFIKSQLFNNYANKVATGSTIKNVSLKAIRELEIPLPPSEEMQLQIVSEIEKRFSEADNLEKAIDESLAKAEKLRQSILKQAFEGKLV